MPLKSTSLAKFKLSLVLWFSVMTALVVITTTSLSLTREENAKSYTYTDKPAPTKGGDAAIPSGAVALPPPATVVNSAAQEQAYGQLPLSFEPNFGQSEAQVRYLAKAGGVSTVSNRWSDGYSDQSGSL